MKLLIWGIGGRLGKMLLETASSKEYITKIVGFDKFANPKDFEKVQVFNNVNDIKESFDLIVDFSKPDAINEYLDFAKKHKTPVVIATTGHTDEQMNLINSAAKNIAIFKSTNMSIGVNLLIELSKIAAEKLGDGFDIEIVEAHHNIKVDSPSGTADTISKEINSVFDNSKKFVYGRYSRNDRRTKNEIGIHSIRGGSVVGKHDVMFLGNDEFITLSHQAQSTRIFTEGALKAGLFLQNKKPGLYNMKDLLLS